MTTVLTLSHKAYLREAHARHTRSKFSINLGNASTLSTGLCLITFGGVPNGVSPNPSTLQPSSNTKTHWTMTTNILPRTIWYLQFSPYTCNRELTVVLAFRSYNRKLPNTSRADGDCYSTTATWVQGALSSRSKGMTMKRREFTCWR